MPSARPVVVPLAALALAVTAPAFAGRSPQLIVSGTTQRLGAPTTVAIDLRLPTLHPLGRLVLYAPRRYGATFKARPGDSIGKVIAAQVSIRGHKLRAKGRLLAADPAGFAGVRSAQSCAPGRHAAVWRLFLKASRSTFKLPLFVQRARRGSGADYSSWRVVACPAATHLRLSKLSLRVDGVFRNPWKKGAYAWRAVASPSARDTGIPHDSRAVESRSTVLLPVKLALHAGRYEFGRPSVDFRGSLTAGGRAVPRGRLPVDAGRGPNTLVRAGTTRTDSRGRFAISRPLTGTTYLRVSAAIPAQDVTRGGCDIPVAPAGCASATLAPIAATSTLVRVGVPPAPRVTYGARGAPVRLLQATLARLRYLPPGYSTGSFDDRTWHAVVAFEGWSGLTRDGIAGPLVWGALSRASAPAPWDGLVEGLEVDLARQVLLLVHDGRVVRAIHVSTAAPGHYTPRGRFRVYRKETLSWSIPFKVWMPWANYFDGGFAIHGLASVPAYPASHGCIRVPLVEAPGLYASAGLGLPVWVR
jgi:peptidoglycan hydrolase-like protein with peptidoglycan-binding domain